MKTQLLCTFTTKSKLQELVDQVLQTYVVVFDKIFRILPLYEISNNKIFPNVF